MTTTFAWRRSAGTMNIIKQLAPEVVYCTFLYAVLYFLSSVAVSGNIQELHSLTKAEQVKEIIETGL